MRLGLGGGSAAAIAAPLLRLLPQSLPVNQTISLPTAQPFVLPSWLGAAGADRRGLPVPASLAALPLLAQPRTAPPASPPPALPNGLAIPSFISVPLVSPRTLA